MNQNFKAYFLNTTHASSCTELEHIQSLWSGYGKISRYKLEAAAQKTVVVKHIALNQSPKHPRGWNTDKSHLRKVKSYEVETHWYQKWNQACMTHARIPQFIGSYQEGKDRWIILEDLNVDFPLRKHHVGLSEIKACLKWLANFHLAFINKSPNGLWKVGTYWHLATRPDEFEKIEHSALKSKAHLIDDALNSCKYQTIVHGDAKLANFCFSKDETDVAAVDFQYVGGGCGIKDVAYLFSSALDGSSLQRYEDDLLAYYFSCLKDAFVASDFDFDFQELESEWRKMYPFAWADFIRFLQGWMPSHQKMNGYMMGMVEEVLKNF